MPTYYSTHHLHVTIIANNSQVLMEDKTHQVPSVAFVGSFLTVTKVQVVINCQALPLHTRVNEAARGQFPTFAEQ